MLRKILLVLRGIEGLLIDILFELKELNRTAGASPHPTEERPEGGQEWLAQGIDNILGYQVGKKRSEGE